MHQHTGPSSDTTTAIDFEEFIRHVGERVRRALVAFYGVEIGTEAAAEAMVVAWQRWDEIVTMANPAGFLFRVGQSKARPHVRWSRRRAGFPSTDRIDSSYDSSLVELFTALAKVKPEQRTAVLLVKAYGFSYQEAAAVMGLSLNALTNEVRKGMARLRWIMEVE